MCFSQLVLVDMDGNVEILPCFLIYCFTGVFGLLQPLKNKIYLVGLIMATTLTLRRDVIMLEYVHFRMSLGENCILYVKLECEPKR